MISSITKAGVQASLMVLFILAYLAKALLGISFFTEFMALFVVLIFVISITSIERNSQKLIGLLVLIGLICLFFGKNTVDWAAAITENSGITTLLTTAPLLGLILYYSPYERVLLFLSDRWIKSTYAFYEVTLLLISIFGLVMNLGALPFAKQLMSSVAKRYPSVVFNRAITRGFTINFFWAPSLISLAFTLQTTGVSWNEIFLPGLVLSLLSYGYASLFGRLEISRDKCPVTVKSQAEKASQSLKLDDDLTMATSRRYMCLLGVQIIAILLLIAFFTSYLKYNVFTSIALVSLTAPLLFGLFLRKSDVWRDRIVDYVKNSLPKTVWQFMFFTSIGFFGYALNRSPVIELVRANIGALAHLPIELITMAIIGIIGGLAVIGLHPFITISTLAIFLADLNLGLSQIQIVVVFTLGYLVYALLSPFASITLIWAGLVPESVFEVSMKLNWTYSVLYSLLMTIVVAIWVRLT